VTDLHLVCSDIVETLRKIGKSKRSARDLRDALENEKLKRSGEKLKRIEVDLDAIRKENREARENIKKKEAK
jgi:hypothetical protein